jgi:GNAT superfamily N-acetyltransferase
MHLSWFHSFDRIGSLAYRTELMLLAHDARITERPDYWIVQTPGLPGYYWGNFLLFPAPPRPGDVARWQQAFAAELGHDPGIGHCHLAWEHGAGDPAVPDLVDGLQLIDDLVLIIDDVPSADRRNPALVVRPMSSDPDWADVAALQAINDPLQREHEGYAAVRRHERARHRALAASGRGAWLGAFLGQQLVGQLGIYACGELARFQAVETHPDHRGRGVCNTLVHEAARIALGALGARRLVIVADEAAPAARVYRGLGFVSFERQRRAFRAPQQAAGVRATEPGAPDGRALPRRSGAATGAPHG